MGPAAVECCPGLSFFNQHNPQFAAFAGAAHPGQDRRRQNTRIALTGRLVECRLFIHAFINVFSEGRQFTLAGTLIGLACDF